MMAITRFFLTLTLALLFASMSSAASATSIGAQAVDEAWRKAIIANDVDAVMSNYSKDAASAQSAPSAPR